MCAAYYIIQLRIINLIALRVLPQLRRTSMLSGHGHLFLGGRVAGLLQWSSRPRPGVLA